MDRITVVAILFWLTPALFGMGLVVASVLR
jgi:hypothetical protein